MPQHHQQQQQQQQALHQQPPPAYHPWGPQVPQQPPHHPSPVLQQQHGASKRALSDSDCEDVFSEESCSTKEPCGSPGDNDCQLMSRKRRRGIIEKRRRDRINNSLTELRRLVPSAFEKQGSAKLEKAEILQLTVEHLRNLHNKGPDALAYEPHKVAMDYHGLGFRECAAEVARYLVTVEGMDVQDPLRLRLMSHLQCFAAQREIATKQAAAAAAAVWPGTPSAFTQSPYTPPSTAATGPTGLAPPPPPPLLPSHGQLEPIHYNESSPSQQQQQQQPSAQYQYAPSSFSGSSPFSPTGGSGQVKPYRPWGAEVAY
ncbi:hypothetical protein B566_EDAN004550 [Ephemera danica]|nr:hypothetical protein B566_EDAN004550 [Ephemera danica]